MTLDPVQTLRQLVAIPSVNSMGRPVSESEPLESRMTEHLEGLFDAIGLVHERQPVEPRRDNLIGRLDGEVPPERGGGLVLFEAHQDTVPVEGMTIEPFSPVIRQGRLYGRGSCDVKGGMTAMLVALARLAHQRPPGMPTIVMACTVNEEHGFTGATVLTGLWKSPSGGIIPRRPDAAVVAEPTGLDVVVAHKGTVRWRCHARGRAAHSARPEQGENAIYKMARALPCIERYARQIVGGLARHPLCGSPTLSVGTIHGGLSVNTVPDRCTIEIDRRLLPGEDLDQAWQHAVDWMAGEEEAGSRLEHDRPFIRALALGDEANGPLGARLAPLAKEVAGRGHLVGVPFGTDAAFFAAAGVPSVVFGPGSIQQAHTEDEWLPLEELHQAAEVLYRFGCGGLGS